MSQKGTTWQALRQGIPPEDPDFLGRMTLGRELWLDYVQNFYLQGLIANGGSKVKVIVGPAGSGKSHLLRAVLRDAQALGYATIELSAQQLVLNDLVGFYQTLVGQLDLEALVRGLGAAVIRALGYDPSTMADQRQFAHILREQEGLDPEQAGRHIRKATTSLLAGQDLGASFRTFVYDVILNRLAHLQEEPIRLALMWLRGEKLERQHKQALHLYEKLQPSNARYWLNALIRLLRLAGIPGLVVALDDMHALAAHQPGSRRYRYSPQAAKDICEFLRQLIDDSELLGHFLLLIAGRPEMIEDEKRGFKSYDALWMRLQTEISSSQFNPLADLVDSDRHFQAQGKDFSQRLSQHLCHLAQEQGYALSSPVPPPAQYHPLRACVIATAQQVHSDPA
ncbi:MAG: DUF2791 family P-loop domain-containing protein [Thermostichales cyanobacterium HHBFW_bins_127]